MARLTDGPTLPSKAEILLAKVCATFHPGAEENFESQECNNIYFKRVIQQLRLNRRSILPGAEGKRRIICPAAEQSRFCKTRIHLNPRFFWHRKGTRKCIDESMEGERGGGRKKARDWEMLPLGFALPNPTFLYGLPWHGLHPLVPVTTAVLTSHSFSVLPFALGAEHIAFCCIFTAILRLLPQGSWGSR